jgi:hypothetical protein
MSLVPEELLWNREKLARRKVNKQSSRTTIVPVDMLLYLATSNTVAMKGSGKE